MYAVFLLTYPSTRIQVHVFTCALVHMLTMLLPANEKSLNICEVLCTCPLHAYVCVHDFTQLLAPLLKLRQACLHPHVVRGGIVSMKKT